MKIKHPALIGLAQALGVVIYIALLSQFMSSMGERIGAEIYLTELIKPPKVYPAVAFISVCGVIGSTMALLVSDIVLSQHFNWRVGFWFGQ